VRDCVAKVLLMLLMLLMLLPPESLFLPAF
jgi:hypothetical protein